MVADAQQKPTQSMSSLASCGFSKEDAEKQKRVEKEFFV